MMQNSIPTIFPFLGRFLDLGRVHHGHRAGNHGRGQQHCEGGGGEWEEDQQ